MLLEEIFKVVYYCVKNVGIWRFSSPHFLAFGMNTDEHGDEYGDLRSPNAGKYGPERLQIRTLFIQCLIVTHFTPKVPILYSLDNSENQR